MGKQNSKGIPTIMPSNVTTGARTCHPAMVKILPLQAIRQLYVGRRAGNFPMQEVEASKAVFVLTIQLHGCILSKTDNQILTHIE